LTDIQIKRGPTTPHLIIRKAAASHTIPPRPFIVHLVAMLKSFINRIIPAPLSDSWLSKHAAASSQTEFESNAKNEMARPIYHVTSREHAQSIYREKAIFGIDVVNAAHFHFIPQSASNQATAHGVVLGFCWRGLEKKVDLSKDSSTHQDRQPNVLFDVPISEFRKETWELRLYPGTTGLTLSYVQIGGKSHLLRRPFEIFVIDEVLA
jgi:hypothetical protein